MEDKALINELRRIVAERPAPAMAQLPISAQVQPNKNAVDTIMQVATAGLTAGMIALIGLTLGNNTTLIKQGENMASVQEDLREVKSQTIDRFTRQDFLTEMEIFRSSIERNTKRLDDRGSIITDTASRLSALEQQVIYHHQEEN